MKIIDFARKGNYVRFYLGEDEDATYSGSGWDDYGYKENAGPVSPEHVRGTTDLILPLDWDIREPQDASWGASGSWGAPWSKNDLKEGRQPCLVVVPPAWTNEVWDSFTDYVGGKHTRRYYFGDSMEPGIILPDDLMSKSGNAAWTDLPAEKKQAGSGGSSLPIIDWEKKGNVVQFSLGEEGDTDYWGDDWDDAPYEYNADPVYEEYVRGKVSLVFPFDWDVLEPADCEGSNSPWTKDDMKSRRVPCLIAVPPEQQVGREDGRDAYFETYTDYTWDKNEERCCRPKPGVIPFFFGDYLTPGGLTRIKKCLT